MAPELNHSLFLAVEEIASKYIKFSRFTLIKLFSRRISLSVWIVDGKNIFYSFKFSTRTTSISDNFCSHVYMIRNFTSLKIHNLIRLCLIYVDIPFWFTKAEIYFFIFLSQVHATNDTVRFLLTTLKSFPCACQTTKAFFSLETFRSLVSGELSVSFFQAFFMLTNSRKLSH